MQKKPAQLKKKTKKPNPVRELENQIDSIIMSVLTPEKP